MRSISEIQPPPPQAGCVVETPDNSLELDVEQAANAATIAGVAFGRHLPDHAVVVAYATVWQESQFYNIPFGDRDSVGLFQQRPSMDWGDTEDLLDPVFASEAFYEELVAVPDYTELPVFEAAQEVQRSADGDFYEQHEERSRVMVEAFTGAVGPAVDCWFAQVERSDVDVEAAAAELTRVFGVSPNELPLEEAHPTGELGWAMALWAVSQAQEYGLETVTYGQYRWSAGQNEDNWEELDEAALPEGELRIA